MPDRIAQLPEPFEGGVFDHGFVEAHGFVYFKTGGSGTFVSAAGGLFFSASRFF